MNKPYILCAAIWYPDEPTAVHGPKNIEQGLVISGWRHPFIISIYKALTGKPTTSPQGFLTSDNRFVGRAEAMEIAFLAGQIAERKLNRHGDPADLFSEDIY
jgi:hypothetical protein